jgi:NAD(P)-dependent dehydrogenase (short-subunit alcohol dehydrogenase family)
LSSEGEPVDLAGKVAFVTGVARGQGRAHAVKLASLGADIIGVDICKDIDSIGYSNASREDLDETVRRVEASGRRMVGRAADVRDRAAARCRVPGGPCRVRSSA